MGKAMSKGALAEKVAGDAGLKRAQAVKILDNIAAIGTTEVKKAGKFVIPGLVMIKPKKKAATKAQACDVRPRSRCEGEAREDCCESLPSCGAEKEHLSLSFENLLITSAGSRCAGSYSMHVRSLVK